MPRQWQDTPVLLGCEAQPQQPFDVLVNLGSRGARSRRAGRPHRRDRRRRGAAPARRAQRFRHYRELGLVPETHTIAAEETP